MSTKTVRLDDEAVMILDRLRTMTGLSISEVLKNGLRAYEIQTLEHPHRKPYEIFRRLDLGPGGYALAPAREAKKALSPNTSPASGRGA